MPFRGTPAKGGFRKNAGRKPDWFKAKMREITSRPEAIRFIEDCVIGKQMKTVISSGLKFIVPLDPMERHKVWSDAADRGYDKAIQGVRSVDDQGNYVPFHIFIPVQNSGQEGKVN